MSRHWLLALTALGFVLALALSPHPWAASSRPGFAPIAVLPPAAQKPVRTYLDDGGITLPWPGLPEAEQPLLALGYAYREVGALKLPFLGYGDPGMVLYDVRGRWKPVVPLDDGARAMMRRTGVGAIEEAYWFPFWRFVWGWLLFVPLALWYWLQRREERRQADAAGII